MKKIFVLFFVATIFASCDPTFTVDYDICNETNQTITIFAIDTAVVGSGETHTLKSDFGIGTPTNEYLENISSLGIDTIIIKDNKGKAYNKNAMDFTRWKKVNADKNSGVGHLILSVKNDDF